MKGKVGFWLLCLMVNNVAYCNPLHDAIDDQEIVIVGQLIAQGVDINAIDDDGYSPLMHCVWVDNSEITELLLKKGADIKVKDADGSTALELAAESGSRSVVDVLLRNGADALDDALMDAADSHHAEIVRMLIKKGANVNYMNNDTTPLMAAIDPFYGGEWVSHDDVMQAIENGADSQEASIETVKALVEAGSDVNASDEDGDSILMQSLDTNDIELVLYLLQSGVNVNASNDLGFTALMYVAIKGNFSVVQLLVENGANTSLITKGAKGAIDYATERGHIEIAEWLKENATSSFDLYPE